MSKDEKLSATTLDINVKTTMDQDTFLFYLVTTAEIKDPTDYYEGIDKIDEAHRTGSDSPEYKAFKADVLNIRALQRNGADIEQIISEYGRVLESKGITGDKLDFRLKMYRPLVIHITTEHKSILESELKKW